MTIAQQKTPLRFLTFLIGISRRFVITWQHKYQIPLTDSRNFCCLITNLVLSSLIQSRHMILNVKFCLFPKTNPMVSTLARLVFYPVLSIFYMSVQKGVFPSKLKEAKVIPVYKSDETEPGNYRPISLLSVFNRLF